MKSTDKQRKNSDAKTRRLANLKPFQPGQSGNPAGRPKSITLSEQLAMLVSGDKHGRIYVEVIAANVVVAAACGDVMAARDNADRCEGKPRQALDVDMQVKAPQRELN